MPQESVWRGGKTEKKWAGWGLCRKAPQGMAWDLWNWVHFLHARSLPPSSSADPLTPSGHSRRLRRLLWGQKSALETYFEKVRFLFICLESADTFKFLQGHEQEVADTDDWRGNEVWEVVYLKMLPGTSLGTDDALDPTASWKLDWSRVRSPICGRAWDQDGKESWKIRQKKKAWTFWIKPRLIFILLKIFYLFCGFHN